ncbi:MAG: Dabb family protein [Devosia sp.]|nr:Dabb family protein [Devosia sp.]
MITHSVFFSLKHPRGSAAERAFLDSTSGLAGIAGVGEFRRLRQTSPKNGYRFGLTMSFADQAAYDHYNEHPDHVAFVRDRWVPEVAEFLEIDHEELT